MIAAINNAPDRLKNELIDRLNVKRAAGVKPMIRFTYIELRNVVDFLQRNSLDWTSSYANATLNKFNTEEFEIVQQLSKADEAEREAIKQRIRQYNNNLRRLVERELAAIRKKEKDDRKRWWQ